MRWIAGVVLGCAFVSARAELPPSIARILSGHGIDESAFSVVVRAVGSDTPILSHNPDTPRNPASVMKLITTWTALEILGPAYTWPTEVYYLGDFDGGRLQGDLGIKGYGDPYLVLEEFWKMLRAVRRTGLEEITGDLVLDDSYFDVEEDDPGVFDNQPYRTYNVVPNALLVNFKAVEFDFAPNPLTGSVKITSEPVLGNLTIENHLHLADGPCGGFQRGISFTPADPDSLDRIVFDGSFPRRCTSYELARTVLQHKTYTYGLFESLWAELGGKLAGGMKSGVVPENAEPELVWPSQPLSEVIRAINKNSNNVMTRQLLYTLAAEQFGPPGRRDLGVEVVHDFLAAHGWNLDGFELQNGAGLSREGSVTARLLTNVLVAARQSPFAAEFVSSLSLAGIDGTTRGRFDTRSGSGRMHVKSGRIDNVSALAGYLHADGGVDYVFAMLLNAQDADRGPGQELEQTVLEWVQAQASH